MTGRSGKHWWGNWYYDYATVKYDPNGNELWVKRYDSAPYYSVYSQSNEATALAVDPSGNVYVTGQGRPGGNRKYVTIKYDTNGNQLWMTSYLSPDNGPEYAKAIAVDTSGNVYVTGGSNRAGTWLDYATIKYDSSGNELWVSNYASSVNEIARSIELDLNGNIYVTGDTTTVKYDTNGNQLWATGNGGVYAKDIAVDLSGNTFIAGSYSTVKFDSGGSQLWSVGYGGTVKYAPNSTELWRVAGSSIAANAITVDTSGNIYITGQGSGIGTGTDYVTIKYNQTATPEICDGVDNDLDGQTDEGFLQDTYYQDADNDTYGNVSVTIQACTQPSGYVTNSSDCDDGNASRRCRGLQRSG